jgi:Carboxypeptidase regulatory-like domain
MDLRSGDVTKAKRTRTALGSRFQILLALFLSGAVGTLAVGQTRNVAPRVVEQSGANPSLSVAVQDENGVAVPSAHVFIQPGAGGERHECETDFAGRCEFPHLAGDSYDLRVTKEGYFEFMEKGVETGKVEAVEVTLNHQREMVERVNVTYSPPAIDLKKTTESATLSNREIIELPYTVSRDIRFALPLLPEVVQDGTGQVHVAGADTRQTYDRLDGFNINAPVSGLLTLRVSVDAIRSFNVETSRSRAEIGKGSGGAISFVTGMGDDRFRFTTTDFVPSLQSRKGIHINSWTPRFTFSGPLKKGRAWFALSPEGEYDQDIVPELPPGADRSTAVRYGNLAKVQVNLSDSNILTGSYILNRYRDYNAGLSRFSPMETTINLRQTADFFSLKDQITLQDGGVLEFGVAKSRFGSAFHPQGAATYVITPEQTSGNYFESGDGHSTRFQGIVNWFLPGMAWHGRHEFKIGADLDRLTFEQVYLRNPYRIQREDGTLSRLVSFSPISPYGRNNFDISGYAEDHWSPNARWVIEPGVRIDWDQIVRKPLFSPRLATSFLASRRTMTKLTAGVGVYYDTSNLDLLTRPMGGERTDRIYNSTGQALAEPPALTSFQANDRNLKGPRYLNWSVGLEQRLPHAVYFNAGFLQKRGNYGWAYSAENNSQSTGVGGIYQLGAGRRDHYDSVDVSARKAFANGHFVFASYTRSSARSNEVINFSLENPVFGPQAGGPLPWDSPNRLISWGWLPLSHQFDGGYWLEWRSGYAFSAVNENQQRVGPPDSLRFPTYFSLNLSVERRIALFGFQWAVRVGLDNATNHVNPSVVDNNVDSPNFLALGGLQGRAVVGRLRLLGEK